MDGQSRIILAAVATLLAGMLAPLWPAAATRVPIIAFLSLTDVDSPTFAGFRQGMAERGYHDGTTVHYLDPGPVGGADGIATAVRAQLARGIDLLVTSSTPVTRIAAPLAREKGVPVVFAPVNDPISAGIVADLRHPGGNVTGIRLPAGDDLRLEYLTILAPSARRVVIPYNPDDASSQLSAETARAAAAVLGLEVILREVRSVAEVRALFDAPPEASAIYLPRDSMIEAQIDFIARSALRHRLPLSAPGIAQVRQGALFSYGFHHADIGRRAAHLADQIIKGIPAGDLPVETAENYLAINVGTAAQLGLAVPPDLLVQADSIHGR